MKTEKKKILRVGVYSRVSTSDQDVGMQVTEIRQVAVQRNWKIVEEYADEGLSGVAQDRPALLRMMTDARLGKFDVLVVWKLDRLGRSLRHLLQLLDELTAINVGFVAIRDAGVDSTSAQGRLLLSLLGSFSAYERDLLRERVLCGIRKAQADGIVCGRPRREFDLRPALALLREGHGLKSASKMLNVSRATLRRRLEEAEEWPRTAQVSNTPAPRKPRNRGPQAHLDT